MKHQISYSNFIERIVESFSSNVSIQQIKNFRFVIQEWCRTHKIDQNAIIGDEFTNFFRHYLSVYSRALNKGGIKSSTKASRRSIIKKLRTFFLQQVNEAPTSKVFHELLSHFIKLRGFSILRFRETYLADSIASRTLYSWAKGNNIPLRRQKPVIERIEEYLQIPKGTLCSTLYWQNRFDKEKTESTKFGNKARINNRKTYALMTEQTIREFDELVKFKSSSILDENLKRYRGALWTSSEGAHLPSAVKTKAEIAMFLGFCALAKDADDPMMRGMGIEKGKLTLALLAEKVIVEKYLTEFRLARSEGKFNHGYFSFISLVTSLLREETGYLYQKPEFAEKLDSPLTTEQWQRKCLDTRKRLLKINDAIEEAKKSGSPVFELGRDPRDPIANILALKQPLLATMKMVAIMLEDVDRMGASPAKQACLYRDALLLTMLQANPLRIRMYRIMKFDENLIKKPDGSWWLKFDRNKFKNRHSLAYDYEVRLAPEIWNMIELYQKSFRPVFAASKTSNHVFIGIKKKSNVSESRANGAKPDSMCLGELVLNRTNQYVKDSPGFGPHAFRYISAESIIKNNPEFGYFLAAKVLHDKLETVEKHYAHLKTSDFIEPYNQFFGQLWKDVNSNSVDENTANAGGAENEIA